MTTLGLAMLARNAADIMERALNPVVGYVDEIAIILGGRSSDNTAEIAKHYTPKVAAYRGELDGDGRLMDFGAARQQSFDLLETDWILLVDADDIWNGLPQLAGVIEEAERLGKNMILTPYITSNHNRFFQGRIFRKSDGHWEKPIHEQWIRETEANLIVDKPEVHHHKPDDGQARLQQGIRIAETWLEKHPDDQHIWGHLVQDYRCVPDYEKAIWAAGRYQGLGSDDRTDRAFSVNYNLGICHLQLGEWRCALEAGETALAIANWGPAWTLMAEAAAQIAQAEKSEGFAELAVNCADNALKAGNPRSTFPTNPASVTAIPLFIKAKMFYFLNRKHEAFVATEIALAITPANEQIRQLYNQLRIELEIP